MRQDPAIVFKWQVLGVKLQNNWLLKLILLELANRQPRQIAWYGADVPVTLGWQAQVQGLLMALQACLITTTTQGWQLSGRVHQEKWFCYIAHIYGVACYIATIGTIVLQMCYMCAIQYEYITYSIIQQENNIRQLYSSIQMCQYTD